MAYLSSTQDNTKLYLKAFHRFGRLAGSVDTMVNHPEISRMHGIIEWINGVWSIRDISKNGIWLNGERMQANQLYKLKVKDQLAFVGVSGLGFEVENLDKPQDVLIPYCSKAKQSNPFHDVVFLEQYNLLPSEAAPELVIFYDWVEKNWCCESVHDMVVRRIDDGEYVEFSDSVWQLLKGGEFDTSETVESAVDCEQSLAFVFNISQDEESTELQVHYNNQIIDLKFRCHHYLTALLVRYKQKMKSSDVEESMRGWVAIQKLSTDLGLSESHINIQIHRARKQLIDALELIGITAPALIERKKGYVRFFSDNYKIFKGHKLEQDTDIGLTV